MPRKRGRGLPFAIEPAGRAVCLYIALSEPGGNAGSILGKLGMPPGAAGDGSSQLIMRASISKALDAVTREEERITGTKVKVNRVVRRWAAYMGMQVMKNQLAEAEDEASRLLAAHHNGYAEIVDVMAAEEHVITLRKWYLDFKKKNDSLRRGDLYLNLMGVLRERLSEEGVWV